MVTKTLKQEKERRNRICRDYYGQDWQYPVEDDFYEKYRVLANLKFKKPFKIEDCRKFDPTKVIKDPLKRYHKNVINKTQCELVKGVWSPQSFNRENLLDKGICWVRPDDAYCADKYDDKELVRYRKRGNKGYIFPSTLRKSSEGCYNDKKCEWDSPSYQCISQAAMDEIDSSTIPQVPPSWPKDITQSDIQTYLYRYYMKLLENRPQSYTPVFGKGNRCIGYQKMKISQPQTVVNMIFRGMIQAEKKGYDTNRGLLVWHGTGSGKCHAKDTPILMYSGFIKMVQDIVEGDLIMGDDNSPRIVQSLGQGTDTLYEIDCEIPGYKYIVNSEHIMCLRWKKEIFDWEWDHLGRIHPDGIVHIEVKDYLKLPLKAKKFLFHYVAEIKHFGNSSPLTTDFKYDPNETDHIPKKYLLADEATRYKILKDIVEVHVFDDTPSQIKIDASKMSLQLIEDFIFLSRSQGLPAYSDDDIITITPIIDMSFSVSSIGTGTYYGFTLDGNHRYLLGNMIVTHNTCTATGVMEAFWDTNKEIVFVSSVEAIASNPPETFMKCAEKMFPRFQLMSKPVKQAFEERKVKFFTFAQLAHWLLISHPLKVKPSEEENYKSLLKNAILIIDEVHNIFKPLPHQKAEHFALRDFLADYDNKYTRNLKIAILTATPGDSPREIVDLLNLVRDRKSPRIEIPGPDDMLKFSKSIKGLVSYFNIASDLSKYPLVKMVEPHMASMSMTQYKKYVDAFNDVKAVDKDYDALVKAEKVDKYYKPARKYSNMLFKWESKFTLNEFSSKLPILFDQIAKYTKEKHYIYSTFFENRGFGGHGILAIAKLLESKYGYEKLTYQEAREINKGNKPMPSPKKRYMLAITNELSGKSKSQATGANLNELVKLFNNAANNNGQIVQLFLASQKFNEGVDFKALRNVHIFEPFLSANKEIQTIGRGARYCSHSQLNKSDGEWIVRVHRYIADFPLEIKTMDFKELHNRLTEIKEDIEDEEGRLEEIKGKRGKDVTSLRNQIKQRIKDLKADLTKAKKVVKETSSLDPEKYYMIDQAIEKEVQDRLKTQTMLLMAMKMNAVDCKLFKNFHGQTGDTYTCDVIKK